VRKSNPFAQPTCFSLFRLARIADSLTHRARQGNIRDTLSSLNQKIFLRIYSPSLHADWTSVTSSTSREESSIEDTRPPDVKHRQKLRCTCATEVRQRERRTTYDTVPISCSHSTFEEELRPESNAAE